MPGAPIHRLDQSAFRQHSADGMDVHRIANHFESSPHDHLFHELVCVEAGSALHRTCKGDQRLRPGDIIVIQPHVWHAYRQPRDFTIINCLINTRRMHQFDPVLSGIASALDLYRRRSRRPHLEAPVVLHAPPAVAHTLVQRLETIMTEQRDQQPGWRAAAAVSVLDVLVTVARLSVRAHTPDAAPVTATANRTTQAVFDTVSHLEARFDRPVHLTELARAVHLSPGHLSRSFAHRMGMGIVEFVHRLRAEEACRLLRTSDRAISAIALTVGYNEVAYFSRSFRRQIGQSPRAYRTACHMDPAPPRTT